MAKSLREKLKKDVVLLDGAFGTYAESLGMRESDFKDHPGCMEYLSMTRPELISKIHSDYLDAGSDAVETNTFGGNALKLSEYGLGKEVYEINLESTKLARAACDEFSVPSRPRYVIGSMGPTGKLPSSSDPALGDVSYDELKKMFYKQALGMIDGGADALLIETGQDLLEMKTAVNGARQAIKEKGKDLVVMAQCTLANNGRMLLGTELSAVSATLGYMGVDVVGLNCSTGPLEMEGALAVLGRGASTYISCVPNAGLPVEEDGRTVYPLSPEEMADIISSFIRKYRMDVVGGCCGTDPRHIKAIHKIIRKVRKKNRIYNTSYASFYKGVDLKDMSRPIIVGERINTQGSRKMKELLIAEDYDSIVELGKDQQKQGAQLLDVCSVLTERSTEKRDAVILTKQLAESVQVPLMIDSTDVGVIEEALKNYPGTAFINSVNLEDGGEKMRKVFALAKEHAAFVVCLAIDEKGMAKTIERKLEIADKIYSTATMEFEIEPHRLMFDLLTFSLGTGEEEYAGAAFNTCRAIKLLKKKHPHVLTALGVSNISFGLSKEARKVLNMVFLKYAVKAGLDMAIVNPAELIKYKDISRKERKLAGELVWNSSKNALTNFVEYFSGRTSKTPVKKVVEENLSIEEALKRCIYERDKTRILPLIDEAMKQYEPQDIINNMLMDAMRVVGDRLDSGEVVLPHVLQSAEVMRKAIDYLDVHMPKGSTGKRGKVLLATVQGDVHDIGKNLVKMILKNNGFDVIDLGKQVPVATIVEEARKNNVDAVGLSALLVSTARHMKTCVQSMHDASLEYPVLVGGAPVNEHFAREIASLKDESIYKGGIFYARDAFTGLRIMQVLTDPEKKKEAMNEYAARAGKHKEEPEVVRAVKDAPDSKKIKKAQEVPDAPFYGPRTITNIPADEVFTYLDKRAVFNLAWGAKLKDESEKARIIKEEYEPLLYELKEEALSKGWLDLKVVYGYFKCRIKKDDMDILNDKGDVLDTIHFTRTEKDFGITDYFTSGTDAVAFQAVTVGEKINKAVEELNDTKEFTKAFFLHGMSVHLAEALAAYVHDRVRSELGLKKNQGKRYSPGYPMWQDLEDQKKIFKLLGVEKAIGVKLTEGFQMIPEQSTTAMIVYNDKAEY